MESGACEFGNPFWGSCGLGGGTKWKSGAQCSARKKEGPQRGPKCILANLPVVSAFLAEGSLYALSLGLVSAFGLLPYEIRHSKSTHGRHCSGSVVHISAEASTTRGGTASALKESDGDIIAFALWAFHF